MGIDPVDVGERTSADMMIDADQKAIFETVEAGAMDAVALKNDRGLVAASDAAGLHHFIRKWKRPVDAGYAVVQHDVGLLAHRAQNLAAGERRTDSVAIRPGVRCQHESFVLSDLPEYVFEHVARPSLHWIPCGVCVFFLPAPTILRPALFLFCPVQTEIQLGRSAEVQPLHQLVTDIFASCFQTF